MVQEKVFTCYVPDSNGANLAEAVAKLSEPAKYANWSEVTAKVADEKLSILYTDRSYAICVFPFIAGHFRT